MFKYSTMNQEIRHKQVEEQHYRLRHLNTGRLVIDQEIEYKGIKIRTLGLSPHCVVNNIKEFSEKQFDMVTKQLDDIDELGEFHIEGKHGKPIAGAPISYEDLDQRSRFKIISTSPSLDPRIKVNSCVQIQHVMTETFLSYKSTTSFAAQNV